MSNATDNFAARANTQPNGVAGTLRCPCSVLMSTYADEQATYLDAALRSIEEQTLPPQQIVLVVDGPIPAAQDRAIEEAQRRAREIDFVVVRSPVRAGLAAAMNAGLPYCTQPWVARMDSDDIAYPVRLEHEWDYLCRHPDVDVIAGLQAEFQDDSPEKVLAVKPAPESHDEIVRTLIWRNVISHPTIMVRKQMLVQIGGYSESVGLLEDYELHMQLVRRGARYAMLQEPLVLVRVSRGQRARRGGWRYVRHEWRFRYRCFRRGDLTLWEFLLTGTAKSVFGLLPPIVKGVLYRFVRNSAR